MWSQVDVYMNNKLVSLNSSHYPLKAYLKTVLSSGSDEQNSQLQSQLFFKDDDPMDSVTLNSGFVNRYEYTKLSREFELEGPLMEDVFDMDKYLIQGVDLYIKLYRSSNPFVLMSGEASPDYKLKILDAAFKTCKVKVDSGVVVNHVKQIEKEPAKYFVRCTEIKKEHNCKGLWRIHMGQHVPEKTVTSHSRSPFPEGWKRLLRVQSLEFQALFCDGRRTLRQRR